MVTFWQRKRATEKEQTLIYDVALIRVLIDVLNNCGYTYIVHKVKSKCNRKGRPQKAGLLVTI